MKTHENHLMPLAGTLVTLGIIFGTDRLLGYPLLSLDRGWRTSIGSIWASIEEPRGVTLRTPYAVKALGVLMCSIGVFLMWSGSILGARTSGIATLFGITGSGLILSRPKRS